MKKRILLSAIVIAILGVSLSACLLRVRAPVPAVVVYGPPVEYDYQPMLYDGYVVYYTDDGIPFYYSGGVQVWIPVHARAHYIDHWHHHHRAYHRWYSKRGHYYRSRRYVKHKNEQKRLKKAKKKKKLKKVREAPRLKKADQHRLRPVD
jgi:hypothetical protein